jgi:hypothetical protein
MSRRTLALAILVVAVFLIAYIVVAAPRPLSSMSSPSASDPLMQAILAGLVILALGIVVAIVLASLIARRRRC